MADKKTINRSSNDIEDKIVTKNKRGMYGNASKSSNKEISLMEINGDKNTEKCMNISTENKPNLKRKKEKCNKYMSNSLIIKHSSVHKDTENKRRTKMDASPKHKKQKMSPANICINEEHNSVQNIKDYKEAKKYMMPISNNANNSASSEVSPRTKNRKVNHIKNLDCNESITEEKNIVSITNHSHNAILPNHNTKCSILEDLTFHDIHQTGNKIKDSTLGLFQKLSDHDEDLKQMQGENKNQVGEKSTPSYTKEKNECEEDIKFVDKCNTILAEKEYEKDLNNENKNEINQKNIMVTEELKQKTGTWVKEMEDVDYCKGSASNISYEETNTIIERANPLEKANNNLSIISEMKTNDLAKYKESNTALNEENIYFNQNSDMTNLNESLASEMEQNLFANHEMEDKVAKIKEIKYAVTEDKAIEARDASNLLIEESKVKQSTTANSNYLIQSVDSDERKDLQFDTKHKTSLQKESIGKKVLTIPHMNALEYDKQYKHYEESNTKARDETAFENFNTDDNLLHQPPTSKENQCPISNIAHIHNSDDIESIDISKVKYISNVLMSSNDQMNQMNNTNSNEQQMAETQKHLIEEDEEKYATDCTKQVQESDLSKDSNNEFHNNFANKNDAISFQFLSVKSSKSIMDLQEISKNIFKENIFDERENIVLNENMEKDEGSIIPVGQFIPLNELFQYNKDTESVDVKNLNTLPVTTNSNQYSIETANNEVNGEFNKINLEVEITNNSNDIKNNTNNIIHTSFLITAMDFIKEGKSEIIPCKDNMNDPKEKTQQEITEKDATEKGITEKDIIEKDATEKEIIEKEATEQDIKEKDVVEPEITGKDATYFTESADGSDMDDDFALTASQLSMLDANEKMQTHSSSKRNTSQQTEISDYICLENSSVTSEIIKELHFLRDELAIIKKLLEKHVIQ